MNYDQVIAFIAEKKKWNRQATEEVVKKLLAMNWGLIDIYIGFRSNFQCEYCDRKFLDRPDDYKLWEKDHIARRAVDDADNPENMALSCLICNTKLKNRWLPDKWPQERSERIDVIRLKLNEMRQQVSKQLADIRALVNTPASS